jgi:hypothetical protein
MPIMSKEKSKQSKKKEAAVVSPSNGAGDSLKDFGLEFLSNPPSAAEITVKLQLSGPVKFSTTLNCHAYVIAEKIVVLVTDGRVNDKILDIELENADVNAALIFDDQTIIDIYPPVPEILTYSLGVLRHFILIRK